MSVQHYPPVAKMTAAGQTAVVRDIFTTVHARYDFLNHLLSLRRDVGWRRAAVARMRVAGARRFLDVATGTGDLAIAAARRFPQVSVVGVDFAEPMLRIGRQKVRRAGLEHRVQLRAADALSLPFDDGTFDVTAIAFGMRNIPDKRRALREMSRVTAAGGRVLVLEMTFAPLPLFRPLYHLYLVRVLPRLARLFTPNGATYDYLSDSIRHFPRPETFAAMMEEAGLSSVSWHPLTFGSAYLHVGRRK
ncbi:MAG TPA: class I SAM-dependent methyltransferase [Spirochaetia bacterium]|nr:class I SAM-dependent methyltransferase [Spirochaetia bacterium]